MFYKEDFQVNESFVSKVIICVYRFGNWVYYRCKNPFKKPLWLFYKLVEFATRMCTHCEMPATARIGKGLRLDHCGNGVVIHKDAVIGENVRIFHQVTLGINTFDKENYGPPTIGNNVYIGAGAKIIGKVVVGDNVRIGANAVVIKDIPSNSTAVGIPAKAIPIKQKLTKAT